jgi:predicted DNA-binding protein YlxM (UPF0122 family)
MNQIKRVNVISSFEHKISLVWKIKKRVRTINKMKTPIISTTKNVSNALTNKKRLSRIFETAL